MHCLAILQAFVARFLFFVHSFVAIWRCADVLADSKLWLLSLANVALIVETLITCWKRKGQEWKWFSPGIFIFLLASVPPIWFLELDRLSKFTASVGNANFTAVEESLSAIQGITIPIRMSPSLWVTVIEQTLLLFLIVGRWIMPKGEISRDALSQLLFVYIGMSSDIMELFVLFEEDKVLGDAALSYSILGVWSVSLLQFCFVLTATKNPKKARVSSVKPEDQVATKAPKDCFGKFCTTEAWSIMVTMLMQDGPFLVIRMYVMIEYYIVTYNTIFFTCKNILVLMLLFYRMFVVCTRALEESGEQKAHITVREANSSEKLNNMDPKGTVQVHFNDKVELVKNGSHIRPPRQDSSKFMVPL